MLALLSAFSGELRGDSVDPIVTAAAAHGVRAGDSRISAESLQDAESTASLDDTAEEEEKAGATLARLPGGPGFVGAASFERARVIPPAQAAPPTVLREIPTRPPRG